jgi:hypothetical protein
MPDEGLERENRRTLYLVQALLGLVFENLQAASVEVGDRSLTLHFRLGHPATEEDQDDLDDIIGDFEALVGPECVIGGAEQVEAKVYVGLVSPPEPPVPGRLVFARKRT